MKEQVSIGDMHPGLGRDQNRMQTIVPTIKPCHFQGDPLTILPNSHIPSLEYPAVVYLNQRLGAVLCTQNACRNIHFSHFQQ